MRAPGLDRRRAGRAATEIDASPFRVLLASHDALWWILSAFIGAIGDQHERMEEAMDLRTDIEDEIDRS